MNATVVAESDEKMVVSEGKHNTKKQQQQQQAAKTWSEVGYEVFVFVFQPFN